jgi:hypothetical protein
MHEGPRLKDTQLQQLKALIEKRGWDEATFARAARTPLEALNPSQAREWITTLTKATKGTQRAAPRPTPKGAPPVHHRKKQTAAVSDAAAEDGQEGVADAR